MLISILLATLCMLHIVIRGSASHTYVRLCEFGIPYTFNFFIFKRRSSFYILCANCDKNNLVIFVFPLPFALLLVTSTILGRAQGTKHKVFHGKSIYIKVYI